MIEHPLFYKVCKDDKALQSAFHSLTHGLVITSRHLPLEITVQAWKPKRSEQQNRYLWGVVYATISQATGQEPDDWHEYFLGEFFGWEEHELFGRKRLKPRERSSKQIKARFSEYIEFIISRAAKFDIIVPPPNHDLPSDFAQERG